jgi:hypothetical protein
MQLDEPANLLKESAGTSGDFFSSACMHCAKKITAVANKKIVKNKRKYGAGIFIKKRRLPLFYQGKLLTHKHQKLP